MSHSTSGSFFSFRRALLRLSRKLFGWPPITRPYEVKCDLIAHVAGKHGVNVLVETGTFRGEMLNCQLPNFEKLISIELDAELYRAARTRSAAYPQVHCCRGTVA